MVKCKGCNFRIYTKIEELLDPKKELCDICYVKLDELKEITLILEMDLKVKQASLSEMVEYFQNIANYTVDVESYDIKFRKKGKKEEQDRIKNIKKAIDILSIILEENVSFLKSKDYNKIREVREFLFKFGGL